MFIYAAERSTISLGVPIAFKSGLVKICATIIIATPTIAEIVMLLPA